MHAGSGVGEVEAATVSGGAWPGGGSRGVHGSRARAGLDCSSVP